MSDDTIEGRVLRAVAEGRVSLATGYSVSLGDPPSDWRVASNRENVTDSDIAHACGRGLVRVDAGRPVLTPAGKDMLGHLSRAEGAPHDG